MPPVADDPCPPAAVPAADTPWPALVAAAWREADARLRARLLSVMLRPLGPLSLAALASGAFGMFLTREGWQRLELAASSVDEALRFSATQVQELAAWVAQVQPEVLDQVVALLAEQPLGASSFSASLLLLAWRRRGRGAGQDPVT